MSSPSESPRRPNDESGTPSPDSAEGSVRSSSGPPSGRGVLRAVLWGDVFVSIALIFPALDYYQPVVRPWAAGGILVSLALEVALLRTLRRGSERADSLLLLLALLFGFYAVHNFVAVGMMAMRPSWYGVVFALAGAFFAWAAVVILRLWARR